MHIGKSEIKDKKTTRKNTTEAGMSLKAHVEKMSRSIRFLSFQDVVDKKGTY
jgi:hypothetical protein